MTDRAPVADGRPLVVHVVYRFDTGGLENGVVNLINHMTGWRHAVLSLTEVTDFRARVRREDVTFHALGKGAGHAIGHYPRVVRLLRAWRPAVVHTRNLGALELVVPAWAAGVPVRVHGEHGRDVGDLDGSSVRYQRVRRLYRPFVSHYVALSRDLQAYLVDKVGVPASRIAQIYNGVDADRFRPVAADAPAAMLPFATPGGWVVGTVGRMQTVKNQVLLAQAFVRALELAPPLATRLRLVMAGDGPLRAEAEAVLRAAGALDRAWLAGERGDVPDVMRSLNCFVLPSLAEGISNTILEAMACGLPVIATDVGGNAELVDAGRTGELVPSGDVQAMAERIVGMASDPDRAVAMGQAGRRRIEQAFSLPAMVAAYQDLYDRLLQRAGSSARTN